MIIKNEDICSEKMVFSEVVRNSIHTTVERRNDEESNGAIPPSNENLGVNETNNDSVPPIVPIVRIVEKLGGIFMLDFCDEASHDSFVASCFVTKDKVEDCNKECSDRIYIDADAWAHVLAYSVLVGKAEYGMEHSLSFRFKIALNGGSHDFIPLEDSVRDVVETLLAINRLFVWQTLVDALNEGKLSWKDIRYFLSIVRSRVPFITPDGLLRVVNTHLTFHQFVAFARMVEEHIMVTPPQNTDSDDILVTFCDILPMFALMTQEEQKIEVGSSCRKLFALDSVLNVINKRSLVQ
jgi:hypothetical protein